MQWPNIEGSLEGQTSDKVPTQLCYADDECLWGFAIPEENLRYQWFKLDLDPAQKDQEISLLAMDYPDPKALVPGAPLSAIDSPNPKALAPGYTDWKLKNSFKHGASKKNRTKNGAAKTETAKNDAEKLVTDYLSQLRNHTEKILRLKLGDSVVDTTPTSWTITVPAVWSDGAKAKTQRCALAAGTGSSIRIISEPEAAVVYALDAMDPHNLEVGDNFVLCDAGGGTVDLISKLSSAGTDDLRANNLLG